MADFSAAKKNLFSRRTLERAVREGKNPVGEREVFWKPFSRVPQGQDNLEGIREDYPPKAKYEGLSDSRQVL